MEWEQTTLGAICDQVGGIIQTGPFGSQLHESDYSEEGIPVVMPKDIIGGQVVTDSIARIAPEHVERLSRHKLLSGDIVYGRRGDIGRQALIQQPQTGWLCGTGCLRISLGDSVIEPLFLHYYLSQEGVIAWISNQAVGATMPNLNTGILRSVPVRFPFLPVQRKIAAFLSAYDDLIENNIRRIKILEQIAEAIYREWFVNLRFPGHEKTAFVDSPMGKIPEGWTSCSFTDIAEILSGGTPRTHVTEYWDGDILWFTPRDASGQFFVIETEKRITNAGLRNCASQLYPKDTIFITARGTVGKLALASVPMALNQSCYAVLGKLDYGQQFIFLLLQAQVEFLKRNTGGATFDTIVTDTFRRMTIIKPPIILIKEFGNIVRPIFEIIRLLQLKNKNLRLTRDLLLPKLISGDLDVENFQIETV